MSSHAAVANLIPTPSDRHMRGDLRTLHLKQRINKAKSRNNIRPRSTNANGRDGVVSLKVYQYWSGQAWQLGSAAYWEEIARHAERPVQYRLGADLFEEVGACLLGGYGVPFTVAEAAFCRLRDEGVFVAHSVWGAPDVETMLRTPLDCMGSLRRYRFPRQRARRIDDAMRFLADSHEPIGDSDCRDWLTSIRGVGPKTASWVVRNQRASNSVAIIDVHVVRAGTAAGVFCPGWKLPSQYDLFEQAFLGWASHASLDAALLDACIWGALARAGSAARDIFGVKALHTLPAPVWPIGDTTAF